MVREEETGEIKRRCWKRVFGNVLNDLDSMEGGRSVGDSWGLSVCVLAVSSFGTAVTFVPVSPEIVESQTSSFSRKREAFFFFC